MITISRDGQDWVSALTAEQVEIWHNSVKFLNSYFKDSRNREEIEELFESGLVEPLPISFNEFHNRLRHYFSEQVIEIFLTSVIQYGVVMLDEFGATADTLDLISRLSRKYSSLLKRAFISYRLGPLSDWYRIVTEITIRDHNFVFLKHKVLKNDGSVIEYSGDIPSSFQMTEHIIKQIDRASVLLGKEIVLGNINVNKLRSLKEKFEGLIEQRESIATEIQELSEEGGESE